MRYRHFFLVIGLLAITLLPLSWAAIDDGLIAYWSFDACDYRDDSDIGLYAGTAPAQAPTCVLGPQGNAMRFAGTPDSFLRILDVPVASTQHSYALWLRPATDLSRTSLRQDLLYANVPVVADSNGRPHITLNHDGDGQAGFHARIQRASNQQFESHNDIKSRTAVWDADRWYHLAFTWDGTTFQTFVDGILEQTLNAASGRSQDYAGIVLAIRGDGHYPFDGSLDEVRLYDRVLSAAEIQQLLTSEPVLTVRRDGSGTGTVTSTPTSTSPAGIDCGMDCDELYQNGDRVTLTAIADEHSLFVEWTGGGCSGSDLCTVTMTQAHTVIATFVLRQFHLAVERSGTGTGTVSSDIEGIDCGLSCDHTYVIGTTVTLQPVPTADSIFTGWGGACRGADTCTVEMTADLTVTAHFDNPAPTAHAGAPQTVDEGTLVTLDASTSIDFHHAPLTYTWLSLNAPDLTLSDPTAVQPTFIAPSVDQNGTVVTFELTVTDAHGLTASDRVRITVLDTNLPPLADAGPDQWVEENTLVTLEGSNSADPDGSVEHIMWLQTTGPPVRLSDPTLAQPTFTAPMITHTPFANRVLSTPLFDATLEFEIATTDNEGLTSTDQVVIQVVAAGSSDSDADGVNNAAEDGAPNAGDGNRDGVADRQQVTVASLPNSVDHRYVTVISRAGTALTHVRAIPNPSPEDAPAILDFPIGFFAFTVQHVTPGSATTVTLLIPEGIAPGTVYKFGPTPDQRTPHWYDFPFDGETGAERQAEQITLHLVDGKRGDDDLIANGEITDPSGIAGIAPAPIPPPAPTTPGNGSGGGCALSPEAPIDLILVSALGLILITLAWRRLIPPLQTSHQAARARRDSCSGIYHGSRSGITDNSDMRAMPR